MSIYVPEDDKGDVHEKFSYQYKYSPNSKIYTNGPIGLKFGMLGAFGSPWKNTKFGSKWRPFGGHPPFKFFSAQMPIFLNDNKSTSFLHNVPPPVSG